MTISEALRVAISEGASGVYRASKLGHLRIDSNRYLKHVSKLGKVTDAEWVPDVDALMSDDWQVFRK